MSVKDFVGTSKEWIDEEGIRGFRYVLDQAWMGILRGLSPLFEEGTNVYEKDWDVLLVLDACRVDVMEEVASEYEFLDHPGTHRSTASTSGEWMRTTFTEEYIHEIENTIYITANGHSEEVRNKPFTEFEDLYNYG